MQPPKNTGYILFRIAKKKGILESIGLGMSWYSAVWKFIEVSAGDASKAKCKL